MSLTRLPDSSSRLRSLLALGCALVLALALFLIIPISQALQDVNVDQIEYRELAVVVLDPPKIPEIEREMVIEDIPDTVIELEQETTEMELSQLEISLNPGMGDALSMGVQAGTFEVVIDVIKQLEDIFDMDDLANPPTRVNQPQYEYPLALERRGIHQVKLVVEILIDERGRSSFQKLLEVSHSHPEVSKIARSIANRVRFTVTEVDGRPVKVRGRFPITLQHAL